MNKKPLLLRSLLVLVVVAVFAAAMYPLAERDYYEVFQELLKDPNDKEALKLIDAAREKEKKDKTFTCLISGMGQFYSIEIFFTVGKHRVNRVTIYDSLKILNMSV